MGVDLRNHPPAPGLPLERLLHWRTVSAESHRLEMPPLLGASGEGGVVPVDEIGARLLPRERAPRGRRGARRAQAAALRGGGGGRGERGRAGRGVRLVEVVVHQGDLR